MSTTLNETIHAGQLSPEATRRAPSGKVLAGATAALIAATFGGFLVGRSTGGASTADNTPAVTPHANEAVLRDLVERGIVPAATLEDGTQIVARQPTARTTDEVVADLVDQG